ncbi:MAG: hypothetical protein JSS98_05750 [Bacteroidetes bacterium]|nr:hypothetical protein [Bacteroidota bacterium]
MQEPGREYSSSSGSGHYRYGFNGKENDNEVKGENNTLAFENRIYDSRLGRWYSIDPLQRKYAGLSPYNFVENNPLVYVDKNGKDKWLNIIVTDQRTGKTTRLSILIDHDIKSEINRVYNPGDSYTDTYDWFDIDLNYNITVDKNGKSNATFTEANGKYQTNTWWNWKWKARLNIWSKGTKDADIGEGYLLSGSEGNVDPLSPEATKIEVIENADAFLAMLGGASAFDANNISEIAKNTKPEKVVTFLETLSGSLEAGEDVGEAINNAKEKIEDKGDNASSKGSKSLIEPVQKTNKRVARGYNGYLIGIFKDTTVTEVKNGDTIKWSGQVIVPIKSPRIKH